MGVIFHKNKKYGGTGVKVQSDPAATSLNALEVPNGQTMTSYLNSNFLKVSATTPNALNTNTLIYSNTNLKSHYALIGWVIEIASGSQFTDKNVQISQFYIDNNGLNMSIASDQIKNRPIELIFCKYA